MARTEDTQDAGVVHWDEERGDGGAWVYRASGLGSCIGALVRARMGVDADEPPEWLLERYQEGKDLEDEILASIDPDWGLFDDVTITELGFPLDGIGQIELEIKVPIGGGEFAYVVCHPDGITEDDEGNLLPVEAKAMAPTGAKELRNNNLPSHYQWQVSVEAAVLKAKAVLFLVGEKIANEDRSEVTLGEVTTQLIDPPFTRAEIMKRVMLVEKYVREGEVPFCDFKQYPCGFWTDHDPDDPLWVEKVEVEVPEGEAEAWEYAVDDFLALHQAEKDIKKDKKAAAAKVMAFFDRWKAKGQKASHRGQYVTDVVQVRKTAPVAELILKDHGIELTDAELDEYRSTYEVRYPQIKGERDEEAR